MKYLKPGIICSGEISANFSPAIRKLLLFLCLEINCFIVNYKTFAKSGKIIGLAEL